MRRDNILSLYSDFEKKMLIPKHDCNRVKINEDHDSTLSSNKPEVDSLSELTSEGSVISA